MIKLYTQSPENVNIHHCNKTVMGSDPNVVQLSKYRYFNSVSAFERGAIFLTFFPQEG